MTKSGQAAKSALITGFLSSAISTTFIPVLSEIESKEGKNGKVKHTNNMINVIFAISSVLVIGGWLTAPVIVKLLAKGFQGDQFELAVQLTRIGLPMILFGGIVYLILCYVFGVEEVRDVVGKVKERLRR